MQPFKFFEKIYEHIIRKKKGFITIAVYDQKIIAAAVFLTFLDTIMFKYGASDKKYQHLRANNLIIWDSIKWANDNGLAFFDFGRTEPSNLGLLQHKRGWRAQESFINYYRYEFRKQYRYKEKYKFISSYPILKKMPLPLLKLVGQIGYKHIG